MRVAYFDCLSGISGDMTLGALVDAGVNFSAIRAAVESLGLPGIRMIANEVHRKGFRATHVTIEHPPEHAHRHLSDIEPLIERSQLAPRQKDLAKRIFRRVAEAEARVHGMSIDEVHFHEVGAIDSIADIVGAAVGLEMLGAERFVSSPVPTGAGYVTIAHGRCSIPAPATAELLRGVPLVELNIPCELTTPTGAAILTTVVDSFGPTPGMKIDRIGYGAGTKDLKEQANVLRIFVGETSGESGDQVWVLETNLDDISGEVVGYCVEKLLAGGALDVFSTAVQMKKNRPGVKLTVLCAADKILPMERILFRETTTLGVRRWPVSRHKLDRAAFTVTTPWGPVLGKVAWISGEPPAFSPEFEACKAIAATHDLPLKQVIETAQASFDPQSYATNG